MCYNLVNETDVEFDYYLSLAKIFDEGYPSIPHAHAEPIPEECANKDAPSEELSIDLESRTSEP